MKNTIAVCLILLLASCTTARSVRQEDLNAWVGVPVEALDTHSIFITFPMYKTFTESGIEIRNYANGRDIAQCFGHGGGYGSGYTVNFNTFSTCTSGHLVCNNIFYIKNGAVIEYAPTGQCYTDERVQPQERYKSLIKPQEAL